MNRQQRRSMGPKMTKTDMGGLVQNFEQQINQIRQQVATADQDVDTLMTMDMSTRLTSDQEIQKSDIVAVGFVGRLYKEDGELEDLPFQGGVAQYMLIKRFDGGEFIPGFEEKMAGMKPGEKRTVEVHFPKNYHPQMADKKAQFQVIVIAAWRLNEDMSYVDGLIQDLFKAKSEKDKALQAELKALEASQPSEEAQS